MGKIAKTIGIAAIVLALKGSYHLGKTAADDRRYDIMRRDGIAYLVDDVRHEEARLDENRSLHGQPGLCETAVGTRREGYLDTAADYARRLFEW